jgi:hypothetical protein
MTELVLWQSVMSLDLRHACRTPETRDAHDFGLPRLWRMARRLTAPVTTAGPRMRQSAEPSGLVLKMDPATPASSAAMKSGFGRAGMRGSNAVNSRPMGPTCSVPGPVIG